MATSKMAHECAADLWCTVRAFLEAARATGRTGKVIGGARQWMPDDLDAIRAHVAPCPFDVPNLDGLSIDPADLLAASWVFTVLAIYAEHKGRAMRLRAAGDLDGAGSFERAAESAYAKLPAWAKW